MAAEKAEIAAVFKKLKARPENKVTPLHICAFEPLFMAVHDIYFWSSGLF